MDRFAQHWLEIQCRLVSECQSALFLAVKAETNTLSLLAQWPAEHSDNPTLVKIAEHVLKSGENLLNPSIEGLTTESGCDYFATAIHFDKQLIGILALKTKALSAQQQRSVSIALEQGKQWLSLGANNPSTILPKEFYPLIVKLLAICLGQASYQETLVALVTELTRQFNCGRVAYGEWQQQSINIVALSNSAKFDNRVDLMRTIADAMAEAIEQDIFMVYPPPTQPQHAINRAHQALATQYNAGAICSLPVIHQQTVIGAITLERDESEPFSTELVRLLEQTLALLGPYIATKRIAERSLLAHLAAKFNQTSTELIGLRNPGRKLTGSLLLAGLLAINLIKGDYRIHADAVLEGKIQRVVAAPMDGFILTAAVRAGDTVAQGATMAIMDDADLKLEHTKLVGEQQQTLREYREARANNDLVQVSVISAKLQQIEAQLQLNQDQLQRTTLFAPFDGVVIEGDLSQLLGTPVEKGKSLFKIAPLDGYRIILKVSERLIAAVQPGQGGKLALASLPQQTLPLTVQKITTVAKVEDGENIFRVEASLQQPIASLRPGMEGVAKIEAGKRTYWWIWTHELVDWLLLQFWTWWP